MRPVWQALAIVAIAASLTLGIILFWLFADPPYDPQKIKTPWAIPGGDTDPDRPSGAYDSRLSTEPRRHYDEPRTADPIDTYTGAAGPEIKFQMDVADDTWMTMGPTTIVMLPRACMGEAECEVCGRPLTLCLPNSWSGEKPQELEYLEVQVGGDSYRICFGELVELLKGRDSADQ